ncbi:MaoC family dehydratase [Sphingomonas sp. H39-1-10]|uniref:MaoC family dehydratase n=1 Tax=Sphingomonas TaxID=13687 RepID=UPI00088A5B7B|nr:MULTISPECIES: MaoC family dehydratase [Sphingomonas]MDF0490863.1 MaoC family dehydratase [Sphingomonas pollutisoli]SDA21970.1 Acyl dehydratase [Sphingomonas sp. NFR15]
MSGLYLDDLTPGDAWHGTPFEIEEADVVRFAREYDAQPMHIDTEAAAVGRFGGLIASGWHVAALVMRDFIANNPFGDTPLLGIGIDELRWLRPVRPGDILTARREIVAVQRSSSKPVGTVTLRTTVTNQHGETVLSMNTLMQFPARPA